jgi:hypothetical protein
MKKLNDQTQHRIEIWELRLEKVRRFLWQVVTLSRMFPQRLVLDIFHRHWEQMRLKPDFRVVTTASEIRDWTILDPENMELANHLAQMLRNGHSKEERKYANRMEVLDQRIIHQIKLKNIRPLLLQRFTLDLKKLLEKQLLDHLIIRLAAILEERNRRCTYVLMMLQVIRILGLEVMYQQMLISGRHQPTQ